MKRVKDFLEFKKLVAAGHRDFAIGLIGGLISRKEVTLVEGGRYVIFHGIDGHIEELSERELLEESNIGKSIKRGTFYLEE
jgi:hypothetical protein